MTQEMQTIITVIISALTSSGVMSLILYFIQRHDRQREKQAEVNSASSRMLLGLGHDKIIQLTDKFVRRGAITLKEKRNLEFLYGPYVDLDGNGDCKIGYEACQLLPVISDDEADCIDVEFKRKEYGISVK